MQGLQTCLDGASSTPVTRVLIAPGQPLKGRAPAGQMLAVSVAGGAFGDYRVIVGTSPEFSVGEEVLLFLRRDPAHGYVPAAGYQSKFTVRPDGTLDRGGLSLAAMRTKVARAAAGMLTAAEDPLEGGPRLLESAYTFLPSKWHDDYIPVRMFVNPHSGRPGHLSQAQAMTAAANAMRTWQRLETSYIAVGPIQQTSRTSAASKRCDGNSDTTWGIPGEHHSSTLAITYTCYSTSGRTIDADVQIDTDTFGNKWRVDGTGGCGSGLFDLETVLLHEYGHALGLGHPTSHTDCTPCPIMNASYQGVQRKLCAGDEHGAAALYPKGSGQRPAAPESFLVETGSTSALTWTNVTGELGYEIWRSETACGLTPPSSFALHDTVGRDIVAYTDTNHGLGLPPGASYCYRVRAFNQNGSSVFTNSAPASGPLLVGDADCDGQVTGLDALYLVRMSAGLEPLSTCAYPWADVNCDGAVDIRDALLILRHIAGVADQAGVTCAAVGEMIVG